MEFQVHTRPVKYGDGKTFFEYEVRMLHRRRVVGVDVGPRRETATQSAAIKACQRRIAELQTHRLFPVRVKREHIRDGDGHNCYDCAISLALDVSSAIGAVS